MRKLLLGVSSGLFYSMLSMAVGLLSAPFFLKYLSKETYGLFFLLNNTIIWFGLLNAGLRGSFKIQLASVIAQKEDAEKLKSTFFFQPVHHCYDCRGGLFSILLFVKLFPKNTRRLCP